MPECWWFAKYGYCSAGDECLYAHPKERRVECPDYNRGFCKLGTASVGPLGTRLLTNGLTQARNVLENMYERSPVSLISQGSVPLGQNAQEASMYIYIYSHLKTLT